MSGYQMLTARMFRDSASVEIPVGLYVGLDREPRGRCCLCRTRRVLYRVRVVSSLGAGDTEARCRACWGMLE